MRSAGRPETSDRAPSAIVPKIAYVATVLSPNPYWNEWGVTVEDPDGYRLVLCTRGWSNA